MATLRNQPGVTIKFAILIMATLQSGHYQNVNRILKQPVRVRVNGGDWRSCLRKALGFGAGV
jgi:hypothetical protein